MSFQHDSFFNAVAVSASASLSLPLSMPVSVWVPHSLVHELSLGGKCHNNVLNFVLEDFLLILNRGLCNVHTCIH